MLKVDEKVIPWILQNIPQEIWEGEIRNRKPEERHTSNTQWTSWATP